MSFLLISVYGYYYSAESLCCLTSVFIVKKKEKEKKDIRKRVNILKKLLQYHIYSFRTNFLGIRNSNRVIN